LFACGKASGGSIWGKMKRVAPLVASAFAETSLYALPGYFLVSSPIVAGFRCENPSGNHWDDGYGKDEQQHDRR
jgi:hypothetical protein